ncbi:MAG: adenylate/guanylate cyclase domain-containing protein [Geminicoccaceae bacterium]
MRLLSTVAWAKRGASRQDRAHAWLHRVAVGLGLARARLPLAVALSLAFGLMLVAALAGELVLAFQAGNANTRDLLADRTNLLLDSLELKVESLFQPVARQLEILGQEADEADLDPSELLRGRRSLQVMLGATSQMIGVAIVKPDLRAWRYLRGQRPMGPEDWSGSPEIRAVMASAKEGDSVRWAAPVYSETLHQTVINAHLPVFRDGRLVAMMFAAVALETMVHYVDELSTAIGQPVFVLQGHDHVVARPGLDISTTGPDHPLPLLAEAGDAVLAAMWAGDQRPIGLLGDRLRGEAHGVASGKSAFVVLYRQIPGFGDQPWIVGTYLPSDIAEVEVQRLRHALMLSMACLLAAITATFWLGRRMARPVEQLAEAAQLIQTLELDRLQPLPRSPIVELDHAARAFNAMRNGLAWFETYVPRRLVRQLMTNPSPDAVASRELVVTVLFTDIVGFSHLAERLDAGEAAALLNHHFELLAGCVAETDGTVDKFLGDGMMAFWGAPMPQPDHAERAVRAAAMIRERLRAEAGTTPHLRLRMGIHTGPALVGNIGSRDRLNYTLVGDTVNVAQRLEQLGKELAPDADIAILLSGATVAAAGVEGACQALGARHIRGRDETVQVLQLS